MALTNHKGLYNDLRNHPGEVGTLLIESLEDKSIRPEELSIRELFRSLVESGDECLALMDPSRKSGGVLLLEDNSAINTTNFVNITGQLLVTKTKQAYDDPLLLWNQLCEQQQSNIIYDSEKIPGIGRLGDKGQRVGEGKEYPTIGLNEEYTVRGPMSKYGFIVPLTREVVVGDKTGMLLTLAGQGALWLGVGQEKEVLDAVFGVTNNYNRNGTYTNTYALSGPYTNQQANALAGGDEWKAIEKAELLMAAMTDPNTGEPIVGSIDTVIVPPALQRTANRILTASEIMHVDNRQNAVTVRTTSPSPYSGNAYRVLSSQYVKARTGSDTTWFAGRPKKAFCYFYNWEIERVQAAPNSHLEFTRDIVTQFKVSRCGMIQCLEPRVMTKNT